jgi:hypothetical protein
MDKPKTNNLIAKVQGRDLTLKQCADATRELNKMILYTEELEQLILSGVVATLPQDPIVLARYMHDAYEMLAKNNDWNTQENCKVDFSDLPIGNKNTMIFLAGKIIQDFGGN